MKNDKYTQISITIATFKYAKLEFIVPLMSQDNKSLITDWSSDDMSIHHLYIKPWGYLIIKNTSRNTDNSLEWNKRSLTINVLTKYEILKSFYEMMQIMNDPERELFYTDENGNLNQHTLDKKDTVLTEVNGAVFKLEPVIIIDKDTGNHKGVSLSVNSTSNVTAFYMNEYESLIYIIKDFDITQIALTLINTYMIYKNKINVTNSFEGVKNKNLFDNEQSSDFNKLIQFM